jgi:hypothetical protein
MHKTFSNIFLFFLRLGQGRLRHRWNLSNDHEETRAANGSI